LSTFVHIPGGDKIAIYDGRAGWIAEPDTPVPLMALTGGDLDSAMMDAILCFPAQLKSARSQWRVGVTVMGDRDVEVVEGTSVGKSPVKLYFDKDSGLLLRMVRYTNTLVGQVPTQLDYSDYRVVSGVKMPFKWTATWVDGQSTTELSEIQPNAPINAAKLARPASPPPPKPASH
jgi:outer membrane lipoprotein-sorting protein